MATESADDRDATDPSEPLVDAALSKGSEESGPRDIAEASKQRARALYQTGLTYLQIGRVRDAFGEFKEATRLDPNDREIWQKYEETYREVEAELNAEQAVQPPSRTQAASSSNPLASKQVSSGPLERNPLDKGAGQMFSTSMVTGGEEPPTFTFTNPLEKDLQDLSRQGPAPELDERSKELHERLTARGQLTRDAPRLRNDEHLLPVPELVAQQRIRAPPKSFLQEVWKQKEFAANLMMWLIIMGAVLFYYQVDRKQQYNQPINPMVILLLGGLAVLLSVGCWKCVTAEQPIFVSLSDAYKIVCGLVIVVCVIWHYSRKPAYATPASSSQP